MSFLINWLPTRRNPTPRPRTRTAQPRLEGLEERLVPTVTFHGGNVLPNVEVQGLYYGSNFSSDPVLFSQTGQLEGALQSIAHGPYLNLLARAGYGVLPGSFDGGKILLTDPGSTLKDSDVRNALQATIQNGSMLPPDGNRLYVVFVGPEVKVVNDNYTDPSHPKVFDDSVNDFAGYHQAFVGTDAQGNAAMIRYAVVPTPGGRINNGYSGGLKSLSTFDEMTVAASHEIAESVTNPDGTGGWYDDAPGQGEIGDIANGNTVRLNGLLVQQMVDKADNLIFPADLQVTGTTIVATAGVAFSGRVATAFDRDGTTQGGNLKATISWGDGTTSTGYVSNDPSGFFPVTGEHTYARTGSYEVKVVVGDPTNANSVNTGFGQANVRFNFLSLASLTYLNDRPYATDRGLAYEYQGVKTVAAVQAVVTQQPALSSTAYAVDPSAPLPGAVVSVIADTPSPSLADVPLLALAAVGNPVLAAVDGTSLAAADGNVPTIDPALMSIDPALTDAVFADASTSPWGWALVG